jgi:hypothetical protein
MRDKSEEEDYKAYLANEKMLREKAAEDRTASTYLAHALADATAIGGRFAAVGRASVTGSGPIPHPHLPAPSWAGFDNGPEPPLGYAIDDQPVTGEPGEVEEAARILREREDLAANSPAAGSADVALSAATVTLAVGEPIATSALQSNSSDVVFAFNEPTTGEPVNEAAEAGSPSLSQSSSRAANDSLAVRGGPAPEEVQRAGPRSFRRL